MDYITARAADLEAKSVAAFKIAISKNPAKVKAMLNLWFVQEFNPTFVDAPGEQAAAGLHDIELLDPSTSGLQGQCPVRMFDLDTKNLVDYPDIGALGQYCILSHSWKGREVDYNYVADARFRDFSRSLLAANDTSSLSEDPQRSDIEMIKAQCKMDLEEQEEKIKALASSEVLKELDLSSTCDIVTELLTRRVAMQVVERGQDGKGGLQKAKRDLSTALAALQYTEMEDEVFEKLLLDIGIKDGEMKNVVSDKDQGGVEPPQETVETAKKRLAEEQEKQSKVIGVIKFFERNVHVREAVDEMIGRLQRRRSAVKVEMSIERAKEIFNKKLFPKTEKRYLWIDSCCINKSNNGEYIAGISAMGEWYANADFCLVHLDTKRDMPEEWKEEWKSFKANTPTTPNIKAFRDILACEPEWAKRAWTLQELVMSKTTFYVNSAWQLLDRPVDYLGLYYYFCPFIGIYTSADKSNPYAEVLENTERLKMITEVLDESDIKHPYSEAQYKGDVEDIQIAQKLIIILEILGFRISKDIDMETATSRMVQSVHFAAASLTSSEQRPDNSSGQLLKKLLGALGGEQSTNEFEDLEQARHAINILLKCLVKITKGFILDDRQYVAKFGNVQDLRGWQDGTVRSGFSTHKVMSLACPRESTVAVDRAYSLMGLLGVRFPTFSAEGLTKALSRLLDEVVTSSNDVSVFNWTGKQFGSPIRGRSLYPSSPEAYKFQSDETANMLKNQKLAEALQIKRYEVMGDFLQISGMLRDAITFAKDRQQKNLPLHWLAKILKVVKEADFNRLRPHIINIGKILTYVQTHFDSKQAAIEENSSSSPATSENKGPEKAGSVPFGLQYPLKFSAPTFDTVGFGPMFGGKKGETDTSPSSQTSKRTFGGFKVSLGKGLGMKDTSEVRESEKLPSPSLSTAETLSGAPKEGSPTTLLETLSMSLTKPSGNPLDDEVIKYVESIEGSENNDKPRPELPHELKDILANVPIHEFSKPDVKPEEIESMISPNPIIINNSGIQGFFDIQRVIVTMLQPEKLRRQINNAVSPHQRITGWCTISTGFAMVMVSFACEKHLLEKQLDVTNVIENKILKEQADANDKKEVRNRLKRRTTPQQDGKVPLALEGSGTDGDSDESELGEEMKKVSRMIEFVQEPSLAAVAGEWVLARFSGVPGAKWFLCHLELGSTREFYGHRIPTDEIDFRDAAPEAGLLRCWNVYMMRKKHKLCGILETLLMSKGVANLKAEVAQSLAEGVNKEVGDGSGGSDEDEPSTYLNQKVGQGVLALAEVGAGLVQKLYEMRAEQLDRNLSAAVLKRIPTNMQAALENLNDNKDLMPSMFHSAKKIHMF